MQELKVGDVIQIRVKVQEIREDKNGKHYKVAVEEDMYANTMLIEPKYIVE